MSVGTFGTMLTLRYLSGLFLEFSLEGMGIQSWVFAFLVLRSYGFVALIVFKTVSQQTLA